MADFVFKIDKNIPIPPKSYSGRVAKYPTAQLEVGESFMIPNSELSSSKHKGGIYNVSAKTGRKFTTRTYPEGVRIWRVE